MLPNFDPLLQTYAELVLNIGLNLRPGQRLVVIGLRTDGVPLEAAPFVRQLAAAAYKSGARLVDVYWGDQQIRLDRFRYAPRDSFAEYPHGRADALLQYIDNGDAVLTVSAPIPGLLSEQDPAVLATAEKTIQMENRSFTGQIMRDATNWCVVTAAVPAWASVLFPDDTPDAALDHLWDTLFRICRVYEPDPVTAWRKHLQRLAARAQYLNDRRFAALRFRGPGTDLTVGLPDDHLWRSGGGHSGSGIDFVANVPTEEVYTMPHRGQVDGVVRATMALSYSGDLIDDFDLEFAHGRVVDLRAGKGEATLRNLVSMDEGAGCLGEVALVPHSSPIAQTGLLFYNTLLDENAASHLALGRSYKTNLIDGASLSDEACWLAGANTSLVHVDFMIGSAEIDVDGIAAGGAVEPIMRKGEWSITL